MKTIETVFLAESVTTRSNYLVMITNAKNEADRKKQSPFTKIGRVGGQTIKGWVRHAMTKLLISKGISACHPLSRMSVTADRNKAAFEKDLAVGYHPRGECQAQGGCLVYQMFGDLDRPANLMIKSVYFYPSISGNGSATADLNKAFASVGSGRLEVINSSPRCQTETHQVFMTIEHVTGVAIEAPLKLTLRTPNPDQEVVLLKTLEFLNTMVQNEDFDFLLGGMRTQGYGRAKVLPLKPKKAQKTRARGKNASLVAAENEPPESENAEDEGNGEKTGYKIQFSPTKEQTEELEEKFAKIVAKELEKFPIKQPFKEVPLEPKEG